MRAVAVKPTASMAGMAVAPEAGTLVRWQWVAAHGGAGTSTLHALKSSGADNDATVPSGLPVVIVCRTHASGLLAARAFAIAADPDSRPVGLLTIADVPGRLPTGLRQLRRHVAGAYAHAWHIGWVEAWRCGEPPAESAPPRTTRVLQKIEQQVSAAMSTSHQLSERQS